MTSSLSFSLYLFYLSILILILFSSFVKDFEDTFNCVDSLVVVAALVDIWFPIAGASAARFFKLANIAAKSGRVQSLKKIIFSIANSLGPLSGVVYVIYALT